MKCPITILDKFSEKDHELYQKIGELILPLKEVYPNITQWYETTFLPDFKNGGRKIVLAYNKQNTLIGAALLKNTEEEKKICCLLVREDYRRQGIGRNLMQKSLGILHTETPLITVSDSNLKYMQPLLDEYHFKFSFRRKGVYREENTENYFNNPATEQLKNKILTPLIKYISTQNAK